MYPHAQAVPSDANARLKFWPPAMAAVPRRLSAMRVLPVAGRGVGAVQKVLTFQLSPVLVLVALQVAQETAMG
ncbi:hypothetical protein O159_06930 [Leifsonia xyli subsp. cynodontis DSM 46306]|uniref:Uncharacterized protein n=1 Tax=Leifsonia xyli subsp. cynodontis DSM 46306 TaxID=1389489 RepID=U3P2I1_LEIXC|nr:hypothetical protein O159_02960 [Leifsonia xyli subsp. cynodontis DSM 46306]AGW40870.1 hypothetical protein O159_06930 [Leifsonia xyli subsp. cynodontis DSM 46306]